MCPPKTLKKKKKKNIVNADGRRIYINEFTPSATLEKRKRENDIKAENEERSFPHQKEIKYTKNGLSIGGDIYGRAVPVPDPADIIQMTDEEIQQIMETKLTKGNNRAARQSVYCIFHAHCKSYGDTSRVYESET